jgi:hypothetical protein
VARKSESREHKLADPTAQSSRLTLHNEFSIVSELVSELFQSGRPLLSPLFASIAPSSSPLLLAPWVSDAHESLILVLDSANDGVRVVHHDSIECLARPVPSWVEKSTIECAVNVRVEKFVFPEAVRVEDVLNDNEEEMILDRGIRTLVNMMLMTPLTVLLAKDRDRSSEHTQ